MTSQPVDYWEGQEGLGYDEDLDESEMFEWTPYCWDDCEMCGCHGLCDGEPWDEDIDYEEEDE